MNNVKFYPYLRDALEESLREKPNTPKSNFWIYVLTSAIVLLTWAFLLGKSTVLSGALVGSIAFLPIFAGMVAHRLRMNKNPNARKVHERRVFQGNLLNWAKRRSSERDPIVMALLENIAYNQFLIKRIVKGGSSASSTDLSLESWREQANSAADSVLNEALDLSKDLLKPGVYEQDEAPSYENGLPDSLSAKYQDLLKLAKLTESMRKELEKVSSQMSGIAPGTTELQTSLQESIAHLSAIKEAYNELDNNVDLRQGL